MKDRVVQYPNRIKLIVVDAENGIYDIERYPGTVTEEGTKLNKLNLLQDSTAAKYNLPDTATPNDVLNEIADNGLLEVGDVKMSLKAQNSHYLQCNGQDIAYDEAYKDFLVPFKSGNALSSEYWHPTYDNDYLCYVDVDSKKIYTYRIADGDEDNFDLTDDSFWDDNTIIFGDVDKVGGNWYIFGLAVVNGTHHMRVLKLASLEDIEEPDADVTIDTERSIQKHDTQILRYNGTSGFEYYYYFIDGANNRFYKMEIALDLTNSLVNVGGASPSAQKYYNWTHCNQRCYFNEETSNVCYYEFEVGAHVIRERMLSNNNGNMYVDGTQIYSDVKAISKIGDYYYIARASSVERTTDFETFETISSDSSNWKANFTEPYGNELNYVASDKTLCNTNKQKIPSITYGWLKVN